MAPAHPLYDLDATAIDGASVRLGRYRGDVLLIVNVASQCGYTPQYAGLERLYRAYRERGFVVLGFPCNQFGRQEPGDAEAIRAFCVEQYDVTFPLFGKVDVNGPAAHPLFAHLKATRRGVLGTARIKWNFTKFLVDARGEVVGRFGPTERPESFEADVVRCLDARANQAGTSTPD
jgi:glutathione peroxidase